MKNEIYHVTNINQNTDYSTKFNIPRSSVL